MLPVVFKAKGLFWLLSDLLLKQTLCEKVASQDAYTFKQPSFQKIIMLGIASLDLGTLSKILDHFYKFVVFVFIVVVVVLVHVDFQTRVCLDWPAGTSLSGQRCSEYGDVDQTFVNH